MEARARLSTLRLFSSTKRGGVLFAGVKIKKKLKKGLVAWSWEGNVVCVCVYVRGGYKPYPSPSAAQAK